MHLTFSFRTFTSSHNRLSCSLVDIRISPRQPVEPLLDYDFDAQPFVCAIQAEDARWRQERRQQQQQQEEQEPKDKEPKMAKSVDVVKEVDDEDIKEDDDAKDAKIDDDVDLEYDDVDELVSHVERMRMEMIVVHYSLEMMGYYDSRTRCFIRDLCGATRLPWDLFGRYEDIYCETLRKAVLAAEEAKEKAKQSRGWKWAKVGLVAVAGGVATALTAGLAAPIVGASLVAIGGTSSAIAAAGAFLMTASGAVIFGGAVGAYSFRVIGYRADNRIADVKEFEFVPLSEKAQPDNEHGSMSAIICVSGWHLEQKKAREELEDLWKDRFVANFAPGKEVYGLQWETKELADFGNALTSALRDKALSYAAGKALAYSAVHTAIAAMATPALILEVSQLIDNKYVVALNRSDKAALILADALKSHVQGRRPVTLVGISMGARMLFKALEILAKEEQDSNNTHTPATNNGDVKTAGQGNDKGNRDVKHTDKSKHDKKKGGYKELKKAYKELKEDKNAQNKHSKLWDDGKDDTKAMIMDVILMGAPVTTDPERWKTVRSVIAGRLVNVYTEQDWLLSLLMRTHQASLSLAGIQAVEDVLGVENHDASDVIFSHFDYSEHLPELMKRIKFVP
eukprot:CAMPEP_0197524058 /NCGR_PEP_ID=MMETSP1318-20131121/8836_1 /TAXON_ID=552666 /ORGANISM="Partenskyella glossopodia, Strain RCC365" /LENGTH=623 /DNA_ID=CAMNT_0043076915 /DNA_START=571 /DNA_END=2442 /DNA_ORIENTATION=+